MRIGILTGGGDCAGLNAVLRAVVRRAESYRFEVLGVKYGWAGLITLDVVQLRYADVEDLLAVGGTSIKTSRTNPVKRPEDAQKVLGNVRKLGIDALIAVGGDDTLSAAQKLAGMGLKVVGVPKTIDNDLSATDVTFGFDSAVNAAMDALDRLLSTGRSHDRVMVAEVMGREAGWITLHAGMAAGANLILIPEQPFDIDEVCDSLRKRRSEGKRWALIAVAEGTPLREAKGIVAKEAEVDEFGHVRLGGIGQFLADEIEKRTGFETRATVLGHTIRGGSPSAFDRVLATRFGVAAVDLVKEGKFGLMVSLRGTSIVPVPLEEAVAKPKLVDKELYDVAKTFLM